MQFPISGVEVSPAVPVLVGFAIACMTTPVGVSGAFLLLPFQFSVLGFTAPGVTPTNLLYNVVSTPGGVARYVRSGSVDKALVLAIASGAVPGVVTGSILRVTVFEDPGSFKAFVGVVLLFLGANLIVQAARRTQMDHEVRIEYSRPKVSAIGAIAGVVGGVYGVSGGSIVAPVLAGVFGLSVRRVAAAALVATFITSAVGVISFQLLALRASTPVDSGPDWLLALLFGIGGAFGGYTGARLSSLWPERGLRFLLGTLALTLAAFYIAPAL